MSKRILFEELVARREQREADKLKIGELRIPDSDRTLEAKMPPKKAVLELYGELAAAQDAAAALQCGNHALYAVCPQLQDRDLQREIGTAEEVYYDPRHPYTKGLLRSLPALAKRHGALHTIPGMPPTLIDPPEGDAFACRNPQALAIDYQQQPPMFPVSDTHYAATWLLDPRAPQLAPLPEGEEHYV